MSEWKAKRFWTNATAMQHGPDWCITLDGRQVKTPAKKDLVVPSYHLAQAIAAEWAASGDEVDPLSMPFTRSANTAIDKLAAQKGQIIKIISEYGDSDLLCYRADQPQALIMRQSDLWDPLLDWAHEVLDVRLAVVAGVIHAPQDPVVLRRLTQHVAEFDIFELTALHDLVSLSGSLIIGLAAMRGDQDRDVLWQAARLDETWQAEHWGSDADADAAATLRRADFDHALRFLAAHQKG